MYALHEHILLTFFYQSGMVNEMLSYPFFKGKSHLLGKDLGITDRVRGTGNLQKSFRTLYAIEQKRVSKN